MSIWQNLIGTTKNIFKIGKNKWEIDASNATSLRSLKLGDAEIDFTSPSINQFLKFDGTKWRPAAAGSSGGGGYTEIPAGGTIGGTYEGNVLCLGDVTLNNDLVVKGDLFVVGNFLKPLSSSAPTITVYGNFTVLGYFEYLSNSGTPNFDISGDFTVIGLKMYQETFTPTSVGIEKQAQSEMFNYIQAGSGFLTVNSIIDSNTFTVLGDQTSKISSNDHISYGGTVYPVSFVTYNGIETEITIFSHPFTGGETFTARVREYLKLSLNYANHNWLVPGDIIYFSSNDYATINNLNYNGTHLEVFLFSPNFTGNLSLLDFSSFYLDRKRVFYLTGSPLYGVTLKVLTGAAAGQTISYPSTYYFPSLNITQYRLWSPLSNEILSGNLIGGGKKNYFKTNKFLQFNLVGGGYFSDHVENLPWFYSKRIKYVANSQTYEANSSLTRWELDESDNTFRQTINFNFELPNEIQLTDIFAIEIPSSIIIESANHFTFNVKGNLKLVNCFWTKVGDEHGTNKQKGMKLIVNGDIICRNDYDNANQLYWLNLLGGALIKASGTDNFNLSVNTAGDGGEIICGGDIKGISIYACGGNQFNGNILSGTLPSAGKGGKLVCKNFVGKTNYNLTSGEPYTSVYSTESLSGIWLNGGYAIIKKTTNISARAGDTNDFPLTVSGNIFCSVLSVNGGSYLASEIYNEAGIGGNARTVVINGNLHASIISWCGGRGNTMNNNGSSVGYNGTVTNFFVNGNVLARSFFASSGINKQFISSFYNYGNAVRSPLSSISQVIIKGDLLLDINDFLGGFIGVGADFINNFSFNAFVSSGTSLYVHGKFVGNKIRTMGGNLDGLGTGGGYPGYGGQVHIYGDTCTYIGIITSGGTNFKSNASSNSSGVFICYGNVYINDSNTYGVFTRSGNALLNKIGTNGGHGSSVRIYGTVNGKIDTRGGSGTQYGGSGGEIEIFSVQSSLHSMTIYANGGDSESYSGNGGNITIHHINAPEVIIDSSGGNGGRGGNAGNIRGNIWNCKIIAANGGNSTTGNDDYRGNAGEININYIYCNNSISANGGNAEGNFIGNAKNGGFIKLGSGYVQNININGGNNSSNAPSIGNCGHGGSLYVYENLTVNGDINSNGGSFYSTPPTSTTGQAGRGGIILTYGSLIARGNIYANGGNRQGLGTVNGAKGGEVYSTGILICRGDIEVKGGNNTASNTAGAGGDLTFNSGVVARQIIGIDGSIGLPTTANTNVVFNGMCRIGTVEFTNRANVKFKSNNVFANAILITNFSGKNKVADNSNNDQPTTLTGTQILVYDGGQWRTFGQGTVL
jgi:hypothetical protein